jgi:hypothetical protein
MKDSYGELYFGEQFQPFLLVGCEEENSFKHQHRWQFYEL